jgi:hypothetical protein
MEDSPTIAAVRRFLELIGKDEPPPCNERLAKALDELAVAYHEAPEGYTSEDDREPPHWDFKARYAALGERFPDLGIYAVADPTEAVNEEQMCGDAIDDLTDIERDLSEVVWRFEILGADDAHWHFKLLYRCHWGRHLRELALYVHANTW